MRKRLLLLIISITLGLCGCKLSTYLPRRAEIDRLEFIRIIGIDKGSKDSEDIKITMLYLPHEEESKEQSQGNSGGQAGQQANVSTMVSEGKTISEAIKKAQMESSREIFLGHVFGVIIGDEAAKEDLNKYMDFISRGIEFRLNNNMYIAKGMDAGELIMKSSQSEDFLSDIVEHFSKNYNITSTSGNKKLIELMGELDDKNKGVVIPAIALIEKKGEAPQGEAKDKEESSSKAGRIWDYKKREVDRLC